MFVCFYLEVCYFPSTAQNAFQHLLIGMLVLFVRKANTKDGCQVLNKQKDDYNDTKNKLLLKGLETPAIMLHF